MGVREPKPRPCDSRVADRRQRGRRFAWVVLLWLLPVSPDPVLAQEGPFAFQIRGGGTLPILDFADAGSGWEESAGPGTSLAMGFTFPLYGALGGYLGFGQHRFACDDDVCPDGQSMISTGFDVALRLVIGREWIRPWLQGGLHTHRMEVRVRDQGGPRSLTSEGGGGYEAGAGLLVQVGERMSLSPGVRFGLGNVPFETRSNLALRFLVFDLGLVVGF